MSEKLTIKEIENSIRDMDFNAAIDYLHALREEQTLSVDKLIEKYLKKKAVHEKEMNRLFGMYHYEMEAYSAGYSRIAGVDEAGRGPLAGPVVAAAVILPREMYIEKLNDSKQVSAKQRDVLFDIIREKAVSWAVGIIDEKEVDDINILHATRKAMAIAIEKLTPYPDFLLTDAEKVEDVKLPQKNIIRGDALSLSIAAASIIAKVTRDRMMEELDSKYPEYGFAGHKGYGTQEHINAIKKYGICPIHRVSFTKNFV